MTARGYDLLTGRIRDLEREVREIQSQVGVVTNQSSETWHDNAPYSILVEQLRLADTRLSDAIRDLDDFQILEYPSALSSPTVDYGTRVLFDKDGKEFDFSIVGHGESDVRKRRILYSTPIAQALIGRKKGDRFRDVVNSKEFDFYVKNVSVLERLD